MSHFSCAVILPRFVEFKDQRVEIDLSTKRSIIDDLVADLMAPYDENMEVEPYKEPCSCSSWNRTKKIIEAQTEEFGSIYDLRESFALPDGVSPVDSEASVLWQAHIRLRERGALEAALIADHPEWLAPNPECEECKGTGVATSTYNLKSRWDYWVIGDRTDGYFRRDADWNPITRPLLGISDDGNLAIVSATPPERAPWVIVSPDGEWNERGKMGWFGMSSGDKSDEEWHKARDAIYAEFNDHLAVILDCHI